MNKSVTFLCFDENDNINDNLLEFLNRKINVSICNKAEQLSFIKTVKNIPVIDQSAGFPKVMIPLLNKGNAAFLLMSNIGNNPGQYKNGNLTVSFDCFQSFAGNPFDQIIM